MAFNKFVKTAPAGSTEYLMVVMMDELVAKFNALLAKLDADTVGGADYVSVIGTEPTTASKGLIASPNKQSV